MEAGRKPPWKDIRDQGSFIRTYWSVFEQLKLEDGVIYHSKPAGQHLDNRLIAPEKLREILFKCIHSTRTGGHLGIKQTLSSTTQRFWWPGMKKDITRWCQYCDTCQWFNHRPGRGRTGLRQDPFKLLNARSDIMISVLVTVDFKLVIMSSDFIHPTSGISWICPTLAPTQSPRS